MLRGSERVDLRMKAPSGETPVSRSLGRSLATAAAAGLCLVFVFAYSARATTAPTQLFTIRAIVGPSGIALVRTKDTKRYVGAGGVKATFARGALIRFRVVDKGNEPYVPALHSLDPQNASSSDNVLKYLTAGVASPGRSVLLTINFYYRGRFLLVTLSHGKPIGKPVAITVT
jgi:hypothetical protein